MVPMHALASRDRDVFPVHNNVDRPNYRFPAAVPVFTLAFSLLFSTPTLPEAYTKWQKEINRVVNFCNVGIHFYLFYISSSFS